MAKVEASEAEDVEMKDASETQTTTTPEKKLSPWNPVLEKIMEDIRGLYSEQVWQKLGLGFYVTFWQLEIYDIIVPMDAYTAETGRVNASIRNLDADRSDPSTTGTMRKREKRNELMDLGTKLSNEMKKHIGDHNKARKRLGQEKDHWFADDQIYQREVTDSFIQYCLFPRVVLSPNDASFCSKFIRGTQARNSQVPHHWSL